LQELEMRTTGMWDSAPEECADAEELAAANASLRDRLLRAARVAVAKRR
jgi:hypothetical protein